MKPKSEILVGFTTFPDLESAKIVAAQLVHSGLAACVQISQSAVVSTYLWHGKLCIQKEYEMRLKFDKSKLALLEEALIKTHPYECPQWYALAPKALSKTYADWVCS